MKFLATTTFALAFWLSVCAWSQAPNLEAMDVVTKSVPDGPVARVGKTSIEKIDFILLYRSELNAFLEQYPEQELSDGNRVRIALMSINILLEQELLYQEAVSKKIRVDAAEVKTRSDEQYERLKKGFSEQAGREVTEQEVLSRLGYAARSDISTEIERAMLISEMRKKIVADSADSLPEDAVKTYYEEHKDEFVVPVGMHLKHISIKGYATDDASRKAGIAKAEQALDRIYAGQLFDSVAKEYSELLDPKNGCDLGMVPVSALPDFMAKAAIGLEAGEVSDVIESDTGLHIIQVVAKEDGGAITEEQGLNLSRRRLGLERQRLLVREYCDQLIVNGAEVKVFLELEKNLARLVEKESPAAR